MKPANVLFDRFGESYLSDFGIAKHTNLDGFAGQDQWYQKQLPPESLDGDRFTTSCDIYQVGVTLYRMCNGNEMFQSQFSAYGNVANFDRDRFRYDLRNGVFPDRTAFLPHIPEKLRRVVKKCLEPDPRNRYGSVIEISNDLAVIDGCELDWQYVPSPDKKTWTKDSDGRQFKLEVDGTGNALATKRTAAGRETRVRDYCIQGISNAKTREFLRSH